MSPTIALDLRSRRDDELNSHQFARNWLTAFVVAGLIWRLGRYALGFPLWGDEAFVACDVIDHNFSQLLSQPPEYFQVVPLLYRWILRAAVVCLGPSEYALRLPSLLAGCGALLLFARVAWTTLPNTAAVLATGVFAAGYPLIRHANEVKPYATDALVSVLLLWAALRWIKRPQDWTRPVLLTLLAATSVWLSFPAILIASALAIGLALCIPGRPGWWLVPYAAAVAGSFLLYLSGYAQAQMARAAGSWLENYWSAGFPSFNPPHAALVWLLKAHLSEMMAYPAGGMHYGSAANGLVFGVGILALRRNRQGRLAILLLMPFVAGIAAAVVHRYPYGTAARLAQHLAPFICLFIGCGLAFIVERIPVGQPQRVAARLARGALMVVCALGLARDILKPFKSQEDVDVRAFMRSVSSEIPTGRTVTIANPREAADRPDAPPQFLALARYYLVAAGHPLQWFIEAGLQPDTGWILTCHGVAQPPMTEDVEQLANIAGLRLSRERSSNYLPIARKWLTLYSCKRAQ